MDKTNKWFKGDWTLAEVVKVGVVAVFAVFFIFIGIDATASHVRSNLNKIDAGVITDKNYTAAYETTVWIRRGYMVYPIRQMHVAVYRFTISGKKDGEDVTYTFEVPELDYEKYNIGDYYQSKE